MKLKSGKWYKVAFYFKPKNEVDLEQRFPMDAVAKLLGDGTFVAGLIVEELDELAT